MKFLSCCGRGSAVPVTFHNGLPLAGTKSQARNKLPLQEQVNHQRGDDSDDGAGRQEVVVAQELSLQVVDGGGNREAVAALDEDQRPEVVVIDEDDLRGVQGCICP
jgi:hypothetical protein